MLRRARRSYAAGGQHASAQEQERTYKVVCQGAHLAAEASLVEIVLGGYRLERSDKTFDAMIESRANAAGQSEDLVENGGNAEYSHVSMQLPPRRISPYISKAVIHPGTEEWRDEVTLAWDSLNRGRFRF